MSEDRYGFVGLGRLGLPLAVRMLNAGTRIVGCARGRSQEFVAAGGAIAGDGSVRAVAEAADVIFSCLPTKESLEDAILGLDGVLSAPGPVPIVVEMSTIPLDAKRRLRDEIIGRGGDMLDCPVSGTPMMAETGHAVIYSSGTEATYHRVADTIRQASPNGQFVGDFGEATKLKYVAQILVFTHISAAAEAMAFARVIGLDPDLVVKMISQSPGAASGQFNIRGPLIAAGEFEGRLVTVDMTVEGLEQISEYAAETGASTPLLSVVSGLFDELVERGHGDNDPGKLSEMLFHRAT